MLLPLLAGFVREMEPAKHSESRTTEREGSLAGSPGPACWRSGGVLVGEDEKVGVAVAGVVGVGVVVVGVEAVRVGVFGGGDGVLTEAGDFFPSSLYGSSAGSSLVGSVLLPHRRKVARCPSGSSSITT